MGLFSKKKIEEKQELPPLKFPEFPKEPVHDENSTNPSDQGMIKRTITPPPNLMIPIRKPMAPKSEEKTAKDHERIPKAVEERPRTNLGGYGPSKIDHQGYKPSSIQGGYRPSMEQGSLKPERERTLFVKIENYKEVLAKMNEIKAKIAESEKVLQKLHETRAEEDNELRTWQEDLNRIKDTLMIIDKTLFEK